MEEAQSSNVLQFHASMNEAISWKPPNIDSPLVDSVDLKYYYCNPRCMTFKLVVMMYTTMTHVTL